MLRFRKKTIERKTPNLAIKMFPYYHKYIYWLKCFCLFFLLSCFSIFPKNVLAQFSPENLPQTFSESGEVRELRVGLYENKPKIFTDESGNAAGIFPTILAEIARQENWKLVYIPNSWPDCLTALKNGDIDLMPDIAYSPERAKRFDFHEEAVVSSWSTVYGKRKNTIKTLNDLNGLRIAVLTGSIQYGVLQQMAQGFGLQVVFVEAQSFEEAFFLATKGDADAVVANQFFGDYYYQQYGLEKTPVV